MQRLLPATLQGDWQVVFLLRSWIFAVLFGSLAAKQGWAVLLWVLCAGGVRAWCCCVRRARCG